MSSILKRISFTLSLAALLISCSRPCKNETPKQVQPQAQKTLKQGRQFGVLLTGKGIPIINPTKEIRKHPVGELTISSLKKLLHVNVGDELNIVFTLQNKTDMCLITPVYRNEIQIDVLDKNGKKYSFWPPPPLGWGRFGCPPLPGKEADCTKFQRIEPGEVTEYQRREIFKSSGKYIAKIHVWNPIFLDTHTLKPTQVKAEVRFELTIQVSSNRK